MKKLLYLFLAVLIIGCGTPKSQLKGGCRLKTDVIDDFTKKHIKETRTETLTISGMGFGISTNIWAKKSDSTLLLGLNITSPSVFSIHKGDSFKLLFEDESVMELPYSETEVADYTYLNTLNTSIWNVRTYFEVSESDIQKLLNSKVVKIRINFSDSYFDDDVKDLRQDNIAEVLNCIIAN